MKICFLSSMHPARDKRVFDKEAVSLVTAGHQVTHICPGSSSDAGFCKGIKIVTYTNPAGIRGRLAQLYTLYGIANNEDADCYHCNEVDSWFIGVLLKIVKKKKCIFDVHEHYPSTFAESRFPKWMQPIVEGGVKLVFRFLTPFTDCLVLAKKTVSSDFHCSESKKILARNFTPLAGVSFAKKRRAATMDDTITFVHLGLISKVRGWPQLLESIHLMTNRNICLKIIGEFNDGTREEFENIVKEYGLESQVIVYDWMAFEEAFEHLTNAHIGLVVFQPGRLNHVYAMPHKMFDYMAAGLTVICPDFAVEVAPVIQETGCGVLVDTSSAKALATAFDELVASPDHIYDMGQKGQQAVRKKYNWEVEVQPLLKIYNEWDN